MKQKEKKNGMKTAAINATDIVDKVATDDHCWQLSNTKHNRIKEIKTTKTTRVDKTTATTVVIQALMEVLQEVKKNANRQMTDECVCVCLYECLAWER